MNTIAMVDTDQERKQWELMIDQAKRLIASNALPSAIENAEQALAIIVYGRELNLPPMTALQNISLIKGKPTLSANLIGGRLKDAGYNFKVTKYDDDEVVIKFTYPDGDTLSVNYTALEAKLAGNSDKKGKDGGPNMYQKYPKEMLYARCLTRGGRIVAPEVLAGIYSPEEFQEGEKLTPQEIKVAHESRVSEAVSKMNAAKTTNEALKVYQDYSDISEEDEFKVAAAAKKEELSKKTKEKKESEKQPPTPPEEAEVVGDSPQTREEKTEGPQVVTADNTTKVLLKKIRAKIQVATTVEEVEQLISGYQAQHDEETMLLGQEKIKALSVINDIA